MATPAALCHPFPPLAALAADFPERDAHEAGNDIVGWLDAGSCLWRVGQIEEAQRPAALAFAAEASALAARASADADSRQMPAPTSAAPPDTTRLTDVAGSEGMHALARTVREGAEHLERRGAFRLAYSLLSGVRQALPALSPGEAGRAVLLQGRLARQLGAMQSADDHYRLAEATGRRARDLDLEVRAVLGRGVLAAMRGNYPEARTLFRRGLRSAQRAGLTEHIVAGHNALLMAAVAAKDLDSALTHGWYAFTQSASLPDRQAEILINLGEVALLAGHPAAALAACTEAVTLTTVDRVLLPGYGTGARAAARIGDRGALDLFAGNTLRLAERSRQEFDKAFTLVELAEAYVALGASDEAAGFLARARRIAGPAGYFELLHRADEVARRLAEPVPTTERQRVETSATDAHRQGVADAGGAATVTLSRNSRRVIESLVELGL